VAVYRHCDRHDLDRDLDLLVIDQMADHLVYARILSLT
jgi:hypothetical protein